MSEQCAFNEQNARLITHQARANRLSYSDLIVVVVKQMLAASRVQLFRKRIARGVLLSGRSKDMDQQQHCATIDANR